MRADMSNPIRIGLIGAGKFGGYHAFKCAAHKDCEFVGVFDLDTGAAQALAVQHNIRGFESAARLIEECDAVVIAAPASFHGDYAIQVLSAERHALIEKPMATDLDEAREIVRLARDHKRIVQVGHQERFVGRAIGLDKIPERPLLIKAERLNPFSPRGTDTSVTMDLMTHDIDLVHWLMGGRAKRVDGQGRRVVTKHPDHVMAQLDFDDASAFLEASRVAETGHRELTITYPSGTVRIDLNAKTLWHDTPFSLNANFGDHPDAKDSLGAGTHEFISAIVENRSPFISAQDGLLAVEAALSLDK